MNSIRTLIEALKNETRVFIQPHDFPDPDAVTSAFGLQRLLAHFGIKACIVYNKEIERGSLKKIIRDLKIDIREVGSYGMKPEEKIILVDGCKGSSNVTDLIGEEFACIDHHPVTAPDDVPFFDIRETYGACATIIGSYYSELEIDMPGDVAAALMIGITRDTALFTRGVTEEDLNVYTHCFLAADVEYVNSVIRNNICADDLAYYRHMLDSLERSGSLAFCWFPDGCGQNLLGILADFALSLVEVEFVMLCALNGVVVNFSIRCENENWNAGDVMRAFLEEKGFGGGHADMAGGVIYDPTLFNEAAAFETVQRILADASRDKSGRG